MVLAFDNNMRIEKILIVPCDKLVKGASLSVGFFNKAFRRMRTGLFGQELLYDAEVQFYGDIPKILGKDHTFIFGEFYPHLFSAIVPRECPYPSCVGVPEGTTIFEEDLDGVLGMVDAVLVSIRGGARASLVLEKARKRSVPCALFDFYDHYKNYGSQDVRKELCYDFIPGRDFDLYFKKDLPLGYRTDTVLPLAPVPVRPESYAFTAAEKDVSIFFSGRSRQKCQADRPETVSIARTFPQSRIFEHESQSNFLTTTDYWGYLSRSCLALSPSGKVWDSLRHCEVGLAPNTALVAPRPYVETVTPSLDDGGNAILYDTEFRDGKYHLKNAPDLAEKIRYYLGNPGKREHMARRWAEEVRNGHTVYARSKYVLESMEKVS